MTTQTPLKIYTGVILKENDVKQQRKKNNVKKKKNK
jgi:hypothetical protein